MLEPLAVSDACVAIGECGFDLFYEHSPRDEQETAFRFQIRLAKARRQAARDPLARRVGRHVPRARRRRRARAHDLPLLHRRARRSGGRARARLLPVVQRHRLVQERRRRCATRPRLTPADRVLVETDSPVPHARAVPRQAERARARRRGRRRAGAARAASSRTRSPSSRARTRRVCSASSGDPERDPRAARAPRRPPVEGARPELPRRREHGAPDRAARGAAARRPRRRGRSRARLAHGRAGRRGRARAARSSSTAISCRSSRRSSPGATSRSCTPTRCGSTGPRCSDRRPWVMVSNLPYNVATPVVVRALETAPMIERLLVMVQREVGERLAAGAGDDAYGAVSVKVAYYATAKVVGTVSPNVFVPKPNVESALVRLVRHDAPPVAVRDVDRHVRARARRASRRGARRCATRSTGRVDADRFARGAGSIRRRAPRRSRSRTGRGSPMPEVDASARRRVREAHAVVAHHRDARRRLPRARRDDGLGRASRTTRSSSGPPTRTSLTVTGPFAAGVPGRRVEPRVACGRRVRRGGARSRCTRASRRARVSAADRPTRPRCSTALGARSRRSRRRSAPTCRSACAAGSRCVRGIGDELRAGRAAARSSIVVATPPFGCSTADVYRAWDELGGPRDDDQRPPGRGRARRAAARRVQARRSRRRRARPRSSPAAARRTRSCSSTSPRPSGPGPASRPRSRVGVARRDRRRRRASRSVTRALNAKRPPRWGGRCLLALLTTLPAGLLQQLLVLLLAHALAALFDQ